MIDSDNRQLWITKYRQSLNVHRQPKNTWTKALGLLLSCSHNGPIRPKNITCTYHICLYSFKPVTLFQTIKITKKTLITKCFTDGPRFRIKPYSVQADLGSAVTLMCDVDGNPTPNIVWIHEDSGRVIIVIFYILCKTQNLKLFIVLCLNGFYKISIVIF